MWRIVKVCNMIFFPANHSNRGGTIVPPQELFQSDWSIGETNSAEKTWSSAGGFDANTRIVICIGLSCCGLSRRFCQKGGIFVWRDVNKKQHPTRPISQHSYIYIWERNKLEHCCCFLESVTLGLAVKVIEMIPRCMYSCGTSKSQRSCFRKPHDVVVSCPCPCSSHQCFLLIIQGPPNLFLGDCCSLSRVVSRKYESYAVIFSCLMVEVGSLGNPRYSMQLHILLLDDLPLDL